MASIHLVVSRPFGDYAKGDIIRDDAEIAEVLASANAHDVVRSITKPEHDSGAFWGEDAKVKASVEPVKFDKIVTKV